jgi:hypothetical protein
MTFTVRLEQTDGSYVASVAGDASLRVQGSTREVALDRLRTELSRRIDRGEIVILDIPPTGVTSFAGIFKDDPTLDEIVDEAYRQRDAERPE